MRNIADRLFYSAMGAMAAALGISTGMLMTAQAATIAYAVMAGGGVVIMAASYALFSRRCAREAKRVDEQMAVINECLPKLQLAIIRGTLMELFAAGRNAMIFIAVLGAAVALSLSLVQAQAGCSVCRGNPTTCTPC